MSKPLPKPLAIRSPQGFTLLELMVAMVLSLVLLAIALDIFDKLNNAADLAGSIADVNENLRAGMNMIYRDISMAGAGIPLGGIPLPSGATTCVANPVPLPSWLTTQYFNPACTGNLNVITPGGGFGPSSGSGTNQIPTDSITLISVNPLSQLGAYPLSNISTVSTADKVCCFPSTTTYVTITVNSSTNGSNPISGASTTSPSWVQVVPGQLIMLTNTYGSCVLAVNSAPTSTTIQFNINDATNDPLHFNQFPLAASGPTSGTLANLQTLQTSGNVYPATTAYQLTMTTYYLDNNTRSPYWMLMKVIGTGGGTTMTTPQAVAMGINVLQFAFSCSTLSPCGAATDPTRSPVTLGNIRKVNMWLTAIADHANRKTGTRYTNSLGISVVAQNLAYYNKY